MIPNAPTLDQLRTMPIGDIVTMPAEVLAVLQEDADAALKSAKSMKDWLDGAIAQKFGDRAREARAAIAKDTGIVRFTDGAITIVADLPRLWHGRQPRLDQRPDPGVARSRRGRRGPPSPRSGLARAGASAPGGGRKAPPPPRRILTAAVRLDACPGPAPALTSAPPCRSSSVVEQLIRNQ